MNEEILYNTIYQTLEKEECEFTYLADQGIFFAPELYVATILGKEIKKHEIGIFNENAIWLRETGFENGGPTDFAFKLGNSYVAFELKLRQTVHTYKADIEKLRNLCQKFKKYFIALVDTWEKEKTNDDRIQQLEKDYPEIKRISPFKSFKTKQSRYKGEINCTVCVWKITE